MSEASSSGRNPAKAIWQQAEVQRLLRDTFPDLDSGEAYRLAFVSRTFPPSVFVRMFSFHLGVPAAQRLFDLLTEANWPAPPERAPIVERIPEVAVASDPARLETLTEGWPLKEGVSADPEDEDEDDPELAALDAELARAEDTLVPPLPVPSEQRSQLRCLAEHAKRRGLARAMAPNLARAVDRVFRENQPLDQSSWEDAWREVTLLAGLPEPPNPK